MMSFSAHKTRERKHKKGRTKKETKKSFSFFSVFWKLGDVGFVVAEGRRCGEATSFPFIRA
ncbi:hypothetical protein ES332_D07G156000v1 [Gossypium tomentosum]|uniref:Uncharacterized protein n=1 Tax=Gossypium tomentosum TaxID=34277 RepID=A0A5D2K724_GOSTO|nr:hypothetical protein ES332_D07G156000v1 [Gossypium tomentosum]